MSFIVKKIHAMLKPESFHSLHFLVETKEYKDYGLFLTFPNASSSY